MEEADIVFDEVLVSSFDSSELLEPGKQSFDFPASLVASQLSAVLCLDNPVGFVGRDQFHVALSQELFIEFVAVIGFIPNNAWRQLVQETGVQHLLD